MVGIFFHVKCLVLSVFAFKQQFMLLGLLVFQHSCLKNCMILTHEASLLSSRSVLVTNYSQRLSLSDDT